MIKVAFLGNPGFVQPIREELAKHFTLTESLNKADLVVVAAYGRILTKNELNAPKYGCINVHPSLLPKYRGPTPVQAAILNGDKKTGVTIIKLDEEVDHGPIIAQTEEPIFPTDTSEILYKRLFKIGAELISQNINKYIKGQLKTTPQDHSKASYTKHLTKQDGYVDVSNPPKKEVLERVIRAYHPWPSVWTRLRLGFGGQAKLRIVKFLPEGKIQVEGKKPMSYKDFLNGYPETKEVLELLT